MRDAVIAAAVRTPVGKRDGGLSGIHPVDLSAHVLDALVQRTGLDPALVDDVIWGCVSQTGEQAVNIARNAVLAAGWPEDVPGVTIDRQCGSSQQALHFAAAGVLSGQYDVAVAGGVESMSRVPMLCTITQGPGAPFGPRMTARYENWTFNQGLSAELIAERWNISRAEADEISLESHARAARAIDEGAFAEEIVPVEDVSVDEGVRRDTSLEKLAGLKPVFREDGLVTAGNSSQISDGAAALLVTTSEKARALGLTPLARVHTCVMAGTDPILMLTGPIPATRKALKRAGLGLADIGAFEVNEAFATVIAAWRREIGQEGDLDYAKVNPLGGAIALGHPLGASGARIATTLVHHMRRNGIRYGLQTMCEGGGMANATVFELL
ncbi:acetyl-CoA C-acyltransferase [Carbonactinospora thermoautotrophica]|uniref:Acetyl-CoA acetyltransferase n=1 Tax=Carbonactinospora thermoautotrophica TaxID=1469144 RepID=A0A132NC79_9ACTN|nr:thiolase family protein [Carbonactinospora thermoautotrophica]KWW97872.1 acetyl-CoA acetyltransferase [Carbonactinospora thermoautotrophica]KWX07596.1 acetyl-CoA acetyltransferase [Carbonactinospora thermoautotrophica]MCX9191988.1 acetyl-CoA C-acyltransferase [Carbonactinospora thermoautotrophica]